MTEKSIFVDILGKYISVIECKKTDEWNIKLKQAWENLLAEFISHANVTYKTTTVKSFYDNYKRGGSFGPILDDIIVKLLALIKDQTEPPANIKDYEASFNENHNTVFMYVWGPTLR